MDDREPNEAERLNRLWDATLGFDEPQQPDGLADYAEAILALHSADDAPEPEAAFVARLRQNVLTARDPAPIRVGTGTRSIGIVWPAPALLPRRPVIRLAVAAIAAILLIAALSGGGHWLSGTGPAPLEASAMASTQPAGATATATPTDIAMSQNELVESTRVSQSRTRLVGATKVASATAGTGGLSPSVLSIGRGLHVDR
jgi:hypothetical protein